MGITLLILHGLAATALLGALTHQLVSLLRAGGTNPVGARALPNTSFIHRYATVRHGGFAGAVVVLYIVCVVLGAVIYPIYRVEVRVPFEDMSLFWAVGLFEIKEHWGGIGLGVLPLYLYAWRSGDTSGHARDRLILTLLLSVIVWGDFLAGHFLNNIRGLP
jgi:hypothetical protein